MNKKITKCRDFKNSKNFGMGDLTSKTWYGKQGRRQFSGHPEYSVSLTLSSTSHSEVISWSFSTVTLFKNDANYISHNCHLRILLNLFSLRNWIVRGGILTKKKVAFQTSFFLFYHKSQLTISILEIVCISSLNQTSYRECINMSFI